MYGIGATISNSGGNPSRTRSTTSRWLSSPPKPTATRANPEAEVVLFGHEGLGGRGHGDHLEAHVGREIGDDLARHPQGVGRLVHAVEEQRQSI